MKTGTRCLVSSAPTEADRLSPVIHSFEFKEHMMRSRDSEDEEAGLLDQAEVETTSAAPPLVRSTSRLPFPYLPSMNIRNKIQILRKR